MKVNSVKDIRPGSQFPKRFFAVVLCILVIAAAFIVINNANKDARDTVDIIRVKSSDGIPAKTVVTESQLEKYPIIKKELREDMLTYDKINQVKDKYTLYFLRGKSPIYMDQLTGEKPIKNEWLYQLDENSEVLTLPYDYLQCGGDIVTPGDTVRIRVAYNTEKPAAGGYGGTEKERKLEILFDKITVRDMLNGKGHSIYEVYKEVLKLSEQKRQDVMKSAEFMENILPKSLVLEGTRADADRFARFNVKEEGTAFTITILSRKNNSNIIDQLPTTEKEIESWIQAKK